MKKQRLVVFIAVVLVYTLGCSPKATRQPDSMLTATVQAPPTKAEEPTLLISPPGKLQITYAQIDGALNTEFFAIDIACFNDDDLCFGEPTSLFKISYEAGNDSGMPSGLVTQYDWSPDGSKIALSANKDLFIGNMNTQSWENVTNSPDVEEYEPKWSQDKKYIYYLYCTQDVTGMGSCKLARLNLVDNTNAFLLDSIDDSIASFAISPNGRDVIFSIADLLYQSNLDGSDNRLITSTKTEEKSPNFSPDGRLIVFVRRNGPVHTDSVSDIILRNLASGEEWNLTEDFDAEASSPVFSPDGNWAVFEGYGSDRTYNAYILSIDRKVIIQVTHGYIDKLSPAWRLFDVHQ